jgi:hypothetical protein
MSSVAAAGSLVETARRISDSVAAPAADAVDRSARFPHEALAALREERMLGALVPRALGGLGASVSEVAASCEALSRSCASTAMIYAMHQIEVACLVRHGLASPYFREYLAQLARHEWLIASATSEQGVGGDLRRSVCAVEMNDYGDDSRIRVIKKVPFISYGEEADDILLTARRTPDAAAGSVGAGAQTASRLTRTATGTDWECGTRSWFHAGSVRLREQSRSVPSDVASQTMIPCRTCCDRGGLGSQPTPSAGSCIVARSATRPRRGSLLFACGNRRGTGCDEGHSPAALLISNSIRTILKCSAASASPSA